MKVFLAQALLAARQSDLAALKRPLMFLLTCDEELAGQGSERLARILPELLPEYPLPRVALIGEPTNFAIFPAHKGYASFDLVVRGKGGHSSAPQNGLNAIEKMAAVIEEIRRLNQELLARSTQENKALFPDYPASVFNFGLIQGGLAPNMIAETCRLTLSVRIAPGDDIHALQESLQERLAQEILPQIRAGAPEGGITIEKAITVPPLLSPADSPFCQVLGQIMGQKVGGGAPYATDGGQFQHLGIDSYICGPGLLEQAHQPNESIPVTNFLRGEEKIVELIKRWCY